MRNGHIQQAMMYIEDHLNESISRSELADIAGINPDHFSRMFKKQTGISPKEYITRLRMERAKSLLAKSPSSIMEVARSVGFEDPYHFSRRFKQVVGVAPSAYMASPQLRVVALDGYGHCLALGVVPVAADAKPIGQYVPWMKEVEVLSLSGEREMDRERLATLKPDIIITMNRHDEQELAEIAPVVFLDVLEDPIYGQLVKLAAALGKEAQAAQWIQDYEERCHMLKMQLAKDGQSRRVAILRVREPLLQIYGMQNMGYPFYRSLKVVPPERILLQTVCNVHFHSSAISMEEIGFYEADELFVVVQPEEGARRRWKELQASPSLCSHPAYRSGRIYELDVSRWLAYDPISIRFQMEEAAGLLLSGAHMPE
ncbi:helix-turn-helix domain-containing protein [Paenibacillus senegalimassiliensis]|uniref:helix-turn-helix domain-containing protein n=1 Tax=Paenibacillus senegalimassiliensis TaxID=1737426 RepID=UPI00073E670E|nr:helix-turn-helix domain-containing protein [Paenibacillus senegalimassiliensis]